MPISVLAVVLTGGLADQVGRLLGLGTTVVTVWDIAKWPVLVVIVSLMFAILYWASPNVKQPGFRWLSPGRLVAVVVWLLASAAFAFYVANFSSYNKTYGTLGGVIVFLSGCGSPTSPFSWGRSSTPSSSEVARSRQASRPRRSRSWSHATLGR